MFGCQYFLILVLHFPWFPSSSFPDSHPPFSLILILQFPWFSSSIFPDSRPPFPLILILHFPDFHPPYPTIFIFHSSACRPPLLLLIFHSWFLSSKPDPHPPFLNLIFHSWFSSSTPDYHPPLLCFLSSTSLLVILQSSWFSSSTPLVLILQSPNSQPRLLHSIILHCSSFSYSTRPDSSHPPSQLPFHEDFRLQHYVELNLTPVTIVWNNIKSIYFYK